MSSMRCHSIWRTLILHLLPGALITAFYFLDEAPPEQVFAAFCDPQRVALWWGSPSATLDVQEYDVRTGGTWRVVETDSKGRKTTFHGNYRDVNSPTRIVSTLCYGAGVASKLFAVQETYEFISHGKGTILRLTSRYPMGAALKGMLSVGMDDAGGYHDGSRHQWRLDRLAKVLDEVD